MIPFINLIFVGLCTFFGFYEFNGSLGNALNLSGAFMNALVFLSITLRRVQ